MPNYQKGKIYAIRSHNSNFIYIGSTCQKLCVRFGGHKAVSNKCKSKVVVDCGDSYIELIESYPCQSREELTARENYWIRHADYNDNVVNVGGNRFCPHGREHGRCIDCGGVGICEHGRQRPLCKDCGGSGMCGHGLQKLFCRFCSPVYCPCSKRKIAKGRWSTHINTAKHLKMMEVLRAFDIEEEVWLRK